MNGSLAPAPGRGQGGARGYGVESNATRANVTVGGITRIPTCATRQPATTHGRGCSRADCARHQVWVDAHRGSGCPITCSISARVTVTVVVLRA